MKKSLTTWMIAAAALAVAVGTASAQTYKAEIPLSFHVQQQLMVPGSYEIRLSEATGQAMFHVYNVDTRSSVILIGGTKSDAPRAWREAGKPVLSFECSGGVCALRKIWNARDPFTYNFPGLKLPPGERRLAVVNVMLAKAD